VGGEEHALQKPVPIAEIRGLDEEKITHTKGRRPGNGVIKTSKQIGALWGKAGRDLHIYPLSSNSNEESSRDLFVGTLLLGHRNRTKGGRLFVELSLSRGEKEKRESRKKKTGSDRWKERCAM